MKAPIATKIGSMDELRRDYDLEFCTIDFYNRPYLSSSVYGSATRGPLGFLRAEVDSWEQELAQDKLGFTTFVDSIYTPPHDRTTYSQKMTKKI